MGWRGTLRSLNAAARASRREAERRAKQARKENLLQRAANDVDEWDTHVSRLTNVHNSSRAPIDWRQIAIIEAPTMPTRQLVHIDAAQKSLSNYNPTFLNNVLRGNSQVLTRLRRAVELAPALDERFHLIETEIYQQEYAAWKIRNSLATRLLANNHDAMKDQCRLVADTWKNDVVATSVGFLFLDTPALHVVPVVADTSIVPQFRRRLRESGTLSETKMPAGQFNELYKAYVCSVALRVARDLFCHLPLNDMYVTCTAELLNKKNGHIEVAPILSVQFVRETVFRLNYQNIDPSSAVENFNHRIRFGRLGGMEVVEPLAEMNERAIRATGG